MKTQEEITKMPRGKFCPEDGCEGLLIESHISSSGEYAIAIRCSNRDCSYERVRKVSRRRRAPNIY